MKNSNGVKEVLHTIEEVKVFADKFIADLKPQVDKATVVGLYGDLGAGKTTFTQAVAEILSVAQTVVSPTFVIMKSYKLETKSYKLLIHIDAYRLEKSSELTHLGWQEIISDPGNLVLIEWPERVADIMPEHIEIRFKHISENEREVEVIEVKNQNAKVKN